MVDRNGYQKQLAALVAVANAHNLRFDEILPNDLKAHVLETDELKRARKYIKELEEREKTLQAENDHLKKELSEKQMAIDNLPTEHEARKIELHQTQRQVEMYKTNSENSSKRADHYRKQLHDIVEQKQAAASAAEKIQNLNIQIEEQQAVIDKLVDDNRKSEVMSEYLRESDLKTLKRKDKQLAKKDKMLAELRQQVKDAQSCHATSGDQWTDDTDDTKTLVGDMAEDSLVLQEQNIDLLQQNLALAHDNQALTDQYVMAKIQISEMKAAYDCSVAQHCKSQLFAAAVSEIKTMNRFYTAAFAVLNNFATAFHATEADFPSATYMSDQLNAAQDALAGYVSVKQIVRAVTDGLPTDADQVALYAELDSLGASAADSMSSLEVLSTGFWRFLNQLSDDPKLLSQLNGALCDAGQPRVVNMYICD